MTDALLILAAGMQGVAVVYGVLLLHRRRGAAGAWLFVLAAMVAMLVWRVAQGAEHEARPASDARAQARSS